MTMPARAIQMIAYGAPEVLKLVPVVLPELQPNEIRIRTIVSAINRTDLEVRAGKWQILKTVPFPHVPGVEVVGEVHETGSGVTQFRSGDRVITIAQGMGGMRSDRPGAYADYVTAPADAVALLAPDVDPFAIAALGLCGVTALEGLRRIGNLAGKRILITGAAGGVGSAAVAIARAQGAAHVIGVVSRWEQRDYVLQRGADEVLGSEGKDTWLPPVDGVLDTVGEALFSSCVKALVRGGVLSLVGALTGNHARLDLWELIRPLTLTGYSTEYLDGDILRGAIASLATSLQQGAISPPAYVTMPLADAVQAHHLLERRGVSGRVLLVP